MSTVASVAAAGVAFVAMEGVSYATHRWIMHGAGMRWHRSHHVPTESRWEANDLFPVLFSLLGFGLFATASLTDAQLLYWIGGGVTAYGVVYLFVHEVYIHRRLPWPGRDRPTLDHLREAHRIHHRFGGEPYGMLLPVVPRSLRERAARRASSPSVRSRL
jgi:beta-carotene 3-hydroxylase